MVSQSERVLAQVLEMQPRWASVQVVSPFEPNRAREGMDRTGVLIDPEN